MGLVALTAPATPATSATATAKDPAVIVAGTFAGQGLANIYYAPLAARLRADRCGGALRHRGREPHQAVRPRQLHRGDLLSADVDRLAVPSPT